MAFRGSGRWSRWSGGQLRVAGAAASVVAAVLQTGLWAHGVSEGCRRGSVCAGSAAEGHSRLLAEGTKEEEKREEGVAVFVFGSGREGTAEKGQLAGQIACPEPSCSWQLLPPHRRRPCQAPRAERLEGRRGTGTETFRSSSPGCGAVFLKPV